MRWFAPKCPVDLETKEWVDEAFGWLIDELGIDVLRDGEVVLPTEEHFPDVFNGSRSSIRRMVDRVCVYMDVDPKLVEVRFYENEDESRFHPLAADGNSRSHALGTYRRRRDGKYTISLDTVQAKNPQMLVATIAHELGHVILLGEERLDPESPEHEPMADLVTVFYGLGVFNANSSVVFEQWTNAQFQGWQASSAGYLTEEAFAYALALFAFLRGDHKSEWRSFLNTNIKSYFKSSLRYLTKTNDTKLAAKVSKLQEPDRSAEGLSQP
jgi:hypothetical protein